MTLTFASRYPDVAALSGNATAGLRRWLFKELFLHLDHWPWGSATVMPISALTEGGRGGTNRDDAPSDSGGGPQPIRFQHEPVLQQEALAFLQPGPGKLFIDATLGGGGHAAALLAAGATVLGLDQDEAAIAAAGERLAEHEDHFVALRMNFRGIGGVLDETGVGQVDGIIADLGVSSHQLDTAERGFSFQQDGPLDMRMNPGDPRTAADIVNECSEEELARIFFEYGEEHLSRRAARAIVQRRAQRPFHRTLDLAGTIASVLPRRGKAHPATKVFQALRLELNDELGALRELLENAPRLLRPGGRIAVISFHSLEDRVVKQSFARQSAEWLDRPEWPEPRRNPEHSLRLLTKKPVEPSAEEIARNPRSRSARLRAAERLPS
jgi:16S rRNA (cytosine1402-N4)-methyltransferase